MFRIKGRRQNSLFYIRDLGGFKVLWHKGNRVATFSENLNIKIGVGIKEKKPKDVQTNKIKSNKYSIISFIPQNLLEQFRRIANFYFLCMSIISLSIDSPVSPLTSIAPLFFVISVTMVKQGYEDYLRYRTDRIVNYSLVTVIRDGQMCDIKCQDVRQGDLVRVPRDCDVPCDLVLMKSSDPGRKCNITTANLDGETNLKTLSVPKGLPDVEIKDLGSLGTIECEQPQTDLYSFKGKIELDQHLSRGLNDSIDQLDFHTIPLMSENLLLRGSKVRNTEWVVGCAVYTGQSTKLALNSRITRNKMSSSEAWINRYLIFFLCLLIANVTICYLLKRYYDVNKAAHNVYLGENTYNSKSMVRQVLQDYFSFLILFNYIIPISLYVTIEMQKFLGSFFMEWDLELYDEETDQPFIVNTSDLNEELGQINILFSDKTGTLTKNIMVFQQCSVNGKKYRQTGRGLQEEGKPYSLKLSETSKSCFEFFEALALCHTVQVAGKIEIEGISDGIENKFLNLDEESDMSDYGHDNDSNRSSVKYTFIGAPSTVDEINKSQCNGIRNTINDDFKQVHPIRPVTFIENDARKHLFKANILKAKSESLTRTLSDVPDGQANQQSTSTMTHRRTQSDAPTIKFQTHELDSVTLRRTGSNLQRNMSDRTQTREYYGSEVYTTNDLVERRYTTLRAKQYVTLIDQLDYQASSPDEKALVEACGKLGLIYTGDENEIIQLKLSVDCLKKRRPGQDDHEIALFKRLQVLEFTSDRKRMSVVVQDKNRQLWLYSKGAESHVLPLCNGTKNKNLIQVTQTHVDDFAKEGLRTLAVARKKLSKEEYQQFNKEIINKKHLTELLDANNSLNNRAKLVEECHRKIESGLELLGATAVEDALQDDVKDTLVSLREAHIKVWVLTGDKIETALNIAYSCGHIPEDAVKYHITGCSDSSEILSHFQYFSQELKRNKHKPVALLIDGISLQAALDYTPELFRDLTIQCHAVLCCRLSPLQKCEVVKLMKTEKSKPICASIGDGANDVSMIQEAHVGIGIVGKEGRQAARCSDYAIAKFCLIKKMFLVHGHYFSQRLAYMALYFFYKNLVFMGILLYFQSDSMYSTQSIYDSLFLTLYNVIYTAVPVLVLALTDKTYSEKKLLENPILYLETIGNKKFKWSHFCEWMILGVFHSLIIYYLTYYLWLQDPILLSTEHPPPLYGFGTQLIHNVVVVVNLKLLLEAIYKTYIFILSVVLSILAFMLTTIAYNYLPINYDGDMFHVYNHLLIAPSFWLLSILIIVTALMPDYTIQAFNAFGFRFKNVFPGTNKMISEKLRQRFKDNINNNQTSFNNYLDGHINHNNNLEAVHTTQL
uniref:Phospholipid-transporting ATPase n=1 Tax=Culicoides sonorensis TaxID=179676 RepID=A0A336LPY0_CULSO